ncbi:MAG TPA: HypC/HybG/HupF family hydrogenase formation chaperone [Pseudomonadota bacterium]|jgi:hydrogenase expression/formation protein HypC|nr:HypC/HybG/HupF family hydrogenase formation chaperone [Pseudomonadota bacterium]
MCLAVPAEVLEVFADDRAKVDMGGVRMTIGTAFIENPQVGDWLLVHVGHAINRIEKDEARKTLELLTELFSTSTERHDE